MRFILTIVAGLLVSNMLQGQAIVADSAANPPSIDEVSKPPASDAKAPSAAATDAVQPIAIASDDTVENPLDPASLLPDLPRIQPGKATVIGGTVSRIDRVQDQLTLQVFGGGKMKILFDPRTHMYRDGVLTSAADLRPGDRVSVDTVLDGSSVFASNIRLKGGAPVGESQGVVVAYRDNKSELLLRDALTPEPLRIRVNSSTQVTRGGKTVSVAQLVPGALVTVKFGAQGGRDLAREVSILATPGDTFQFAGRVITLDLRLGLLVLMSDTDHKTYEVYLGPASRADDVRIGSNVNVTARLDNGRYVAHGITVNSPSQP